MNIRNLKDAIKSWAVEKRKREDSELQQIEIELFGIYNMDGGGMMNPMKKDGLIRLEGRRITLLLEKEEMWRLKSQAIWLECGDDNTKFFHTYARGRKETNTVWILVDEHGSTHDTVEGMDSTGVEHFKKLYKEPIQSSLAKVIRIAQVFPRFVEEEDNLALMEEISEGEIKAILQSFQKDKILGLYGWTIKFFLELLETLGDDILKVLKNIRITRRIPASFNSTFIALIPKVENLVSLNDFRPISLCNCICKVVTKVIARRLKGIFFDHITEEQFGF